MKVHKARLKGTSCRFEWGRQKFSSTRDWEEVTCRSCLRLHRLNCERSLRMHQRWLDHGTLPPLIMDNLERARQRGRPTTLEECAEHVKLWEEKLAWVNPLLA